MTPLISIIIASITISSISLLGGLLLLNNSLLNKKLIPYLVAFAAGVMLGATFLSLLPEALETGATDQVLLIALAGIVASFLFERYILWHHHHDDTHNLKPTAHLVLAGDAIHNFVDGIAIAAAFLTNPALGLTTIIAIAAHEIPQELADFSILLHSGLKKTQALFLNFITALTALLGAFVGYMYLSQFQEYLPLFLGFTAGMFLYIASADLIPELHRDFDKQKQWAYIFPFLFGIILMFLLTQFTSI